MKKTNSLLAVICLLAFSCGNNTSTSETSSETAEDTMLTASTDTSMTSTPVDSATMMQNWMAYMTPTTPHKMMKSWNGNWDVTVVMWQAPGAAADTSRGTVQNKMIMGDRYQVADFTGNMMGQPFNGQSMLAYDNAQKQFISTWIDNMGSGIMVLKGPWDSAAKAIAFKGTMVDPGDTSGKELPVRETFTVIDDNHQKMEMYAPSPSGGEFKNMEILYTRK